MRHTIVAISAFLPAIILCGGAVYLAAHGIDGWGWLLVAALFVGGSYSYNTSEKTAEKPEDRHP